LTFKLMLEMEAGWSGSHVNVALSMVTANSSFLCCGHLSIHEELLH
jgi:hypothetical protein